MGRTARRTEAAECRQCLAYCDRVIAPATCVAARCPSLYAYDDPVSGTRYMGCAQSVFATEIDVALFEEAERGRGYGTLKLAREPLSCCAFGVEKAHEKPRFECVNKRFADFPETAPGAIRAFDLRHGLGAA
ncbi:MAG TPA: hypothetical protein VFG79_19895 [Solirubrobacter sp.]|nr:hypothetical protein [Solirubrobacter sp.]